MLSKTLHRHKKLLELNISWNKKIFVIKTNLKLRRKLFRHIRIRLFNQFLLYTCVSTLHTYNNFASNYTNFYGNIYFASSIYFDEFSSKNGIWNSNWSQISVRYTTTNWNWWTLAQNKIKTVPFMLWIIGVHIQSVPRGFGNRYMIVHLEPAR